MTLTKVIRTGGIIFIIDQIIKSKIAGLAQGTSLFSFGPLGIETLQNKNLFIWLNVPEMVLIILSLAVVLGIAGITIKFLYEKKIYFAKPLIYILVGGFSNVVDRLVYHTTIDYIKVGSLVGNLADIVIIVGIIWLFIAVRKQEEKNVL